MSCACARDEWAALEGHGTLVRRWERLYWVPFLVSMAWMAVLSYVLVWMVDLVGDTLGLPSAVTSITTSAAATSVSDLFSSLLVARKGTVQCTVLTHCY